MGEKIQLKHPSGKKAINMDNEKYIILKKSILSCLKVKGELTHTEILHSIIEDFKLNNIKFEGSVEWHMEWVKLDLEANNEIKRIIGESVVKFAIF
jgi:hypothetical protein